MHIVLIALAGLICLVVTALAVALKKAAKFNAGIKELAHQLNMKFSRDSNLPDMEGHSQFYLFKGGRSCQVINLMERTANEQTIRFFEYSYSFSEYGASNIFRNHTRGVVSIYNSLLNLPTFEMYPENLLNRACDRIASESLDILFEHHPKFSRMFMFETEEKTAVRRLFSDQALCLLEECKGMSMAASGAWILFYRKLKPRTAEQAESFINRSLKIYEAMSLNK